MAKGHAMIDAEGCRWSVSEIKLGKGHKILISALVESNASHRSMEVYLDGIKLVTFDELRNNSRDIWGIKNDIYDIIERVDKLKLRQLIQTIALVLEGVAILALGIIMRLS